MTNTGEIDVTLSWREVEIAAKVAIDRQVASLSRGYRDAHGFSGDGWGIAIDGACGELAVAKALGIYWSPTVNTFKSEPDVGAYEVRTRSKRHYDLIVRKDDDGGRIYILVVGSVPKYTVVGWILGKDAKKRKWVKDYGRREPACFVPQSALNPMCDLPKI